MADISSIAVLNPTQLCHKVADAMEAKAKRPASKAFLLSILAGIFIGLGFMFCAIANVAGAGKIVGAFLFSLGLMLVVILGADLFTSTTLTLIPRFCHKISWSQMFSNWILVYLGNFVGSLLLVAIIVASGNPFSGGGATALFYINTTAAKLSHTFFEALLLGIMCNFMVCLAVWMAFAGHTLLDKMFAVAFPVAMFVACGFEHSVANMFMLPMGLICNHMISAQIPDGLLTWGNILTKNLIPVTIGNIIGGGIFVGLSQWYLYLKGQETEK